RPEGATSAQPTGGSGWESGSRSPMTATTGMARSAAWRREVGDSMERPLASVIINNYNYGRFLKASIDSALAQRYPCTDVIVVDDGSTDYSRRIIASYGDKIVSLLKSNQGQASAFNVGFGVSRGEVVCFLDADDSLLP